MNSLTNLNKVFIPNTLDGINIISDEVSTSALLVNGSNKMLADLNMNTHKIKNLGSGTLTNDAINLGQMLNVSSSSALYASSISSSSFIYSNSVSSSSRLYSNTVSSSSFLFTSTQSALKVNKAGDIMTGALVVNYVNASLDIRSTQENQNSILYLSNPYSNQSGLKNSNNCEWNTKLE